MNSSVQPGISSADSGVRDGEASGLLRAAKALVHAEDKLFAELVAEGKDLAALGFPFPLMDDLREAICRAENDGAPQDLSEFEGGRS